MYAEAIRSALSDVASPSRSLMRDQVGGHLWKTREMRWNRIMKNRWSRMSFQEHRQAHYDEFLKVTELRRKGSFLEDKDEDENGGTYGSSPSLNAGAEGILILKIVTTCRLTIYPAVLPKVRPTETSPPECPFNLLSSTCSLA